MSASSLAPPLRRVGLLLFAVLLTPLGFAQEATSGKPGPANLSPEAAKLIEKVSEAYRTAPGLKDQIELSIDFGPQSPPPIQAKITLGAGTDLSIDELPMSGLGLTSVAGKLYLFRIDEKQAVRFALGEKPMDALPEEFGQGMPLAPHLPLRWGAGPAAVLGALSWGMLESPKFERIEEVSGKTSIRRVHFTGSVPFSEETATATVDIDAATFLISASKVSAKTPDGPVSIAVRYQPQRLSEAPALAFAADDYEMKESLQDLFSMGFDASEMNPSIEIGKAAPAFELTDQLGKKRSLAGLQGKYVLLDWWGIW